MRESAGQQAGDATYGHDRLPGPWCRTGLRFAAALKAEGGAGVVVPDRTWADVAQRDSHAAVPGLPHDPIEGDAGGGGLGREAGPQAVAGVPLGRVPGGVVEQRDGGFDRQGDGLAGEPGVRVELAGGADGAVPGQRPKRRRVGVQLLPQAGEGIGQGVPPVGSGPDRAGDRAAADRVAVRDPNEVAEGGLVGFAAGDEHLQAVFGLGQVRQV